MFNRHWKEEIFTIPNLLSFLRIALIPVYMVIYLNASEPPEYFIAGGILAVSCITDMVDGQIARRFHMQSTLGKILDPIADKLTQFTLIFSLSVKHPVLRFVLMLFVVKESFQCIAGIVHLYHGKILSGALFAGKLCTTVLFISLIILVCLPHPDKPVVETIAVIDILFLLYAFIHYIFAYYGKHSTIQKLDDI